MNLDVGLWRFIIDVLIWQYKHKQSCIVCLRQLVLLLLSLIENSDVNKDVAVAFVNLFAVDQVVSVTKSYVTIQVFLLLLREL